MCEDDEAFGISRNGQCAFKTVAADLNVPDDR